MSQLYHNDMYLFNDPVKSYWENTIDDDKLHFNNLE